MLPRPPRWYAIPFRVLLATFIGTLLCFAITLLFAILGTVITAKLHGVHPDMRISVGASETGTSARAYITMANLVERPSLSTTGNMRIRAFS